MMYEVWSLGHKPFERLNGREVHYQNMSLFALCLSKVSYLYSTLRRSLLDTDSHHLLVVPELYMN